MSTTERQSAFFFSSDRLLVAAMSERERIDRAITLLQENEPDDGYHLAFSGGKDSCVCKELVRMAGVQYEAVYNNTTIDPPELVRFIKRHHQEVKWHSVGKHMLQALIEHPSGPPTRKARWCCEDYKESVGNGKVKIIGVRAAESPRRAHRWREVAVDRLNKKTICPIVYWSDDDVWRFIRTRQLPYCELYDEGWKRLGCIGCPLSSRTNQDAEFERWPKYMAAWKRAIVANWERWREIPNSKTGEPRYQAKFPTGEDFWLWWRREARENADIFREDCQSGILWTNEDADSDSPVPEHTEVRN